MPAIAPVLRDELLAWRESCLYRCLEITGGRTAADMNQRRVFDENVLNSLLGSNGDDFLRLGGCNHDGAPRKSLGRVLSGTDHLRQMLPR